MTNTSATGGYLQPTGTAPLEGQALLDFLQAWVVGITTLDGKMVRPRWQPEPPNIPSAGMAWAAIGVGGERKSDTYPAILHDSAGDGSDTLQRNEELSLKCSFYDLGSGGLADSYAARLRDGAAIAQNRESLFTAGFALVSAGEPLAVPSLLRERWLYRVDLDVMLRRQINRTYPVLNILTAGGTEQSDTGLTVPFQTT